MALAHLVDWDPQFTARSAWLWPLAQTASSLQACRDWPTYEELDALYAERARARGAAGLLFKPDENAGKRRPPADLDKRYDGRIALTAEVPTRARNWHDLLNALCFATFPHAKRALHTRQYRAQCREGARARTRSEERDTLTLFDEGGVAAVADTNRALELHDALRRCDYRLLRELEQAQRIVLVPFGHALFEHMVEGLPCPGGSARVVALDAMPREPEPLLAAVDRALASELAREARFMRRAEAAHLRLEMLRELT
jgi:Protein of unknown function (DUF3025)